MGIPPQPDLQLSCTAVWTLKIKADFKFITLSGKQHWCKSQKAGRIKGLKSQQKTKSAFLDLGSTVAAGRWGRLQLCWHNILILFSVHQLVFAWAGREPGDECKSPALLHGTVSQAQGALAIAAHLYRASGTTATHRSVLTCTSVQTRQLKAKIVIKKSFQSLFFNCFSSFFKLSPRNKAHAVTAHVHAPVSQSLLFEPGLIGAAKILELLLVFCKQLARRWELPY